ncbi:MAG: N-6 DNA methylase [Eubacterium sp.]|nr:N-6 DNA methylase [Eubacterium sp.]
MKDEFMEVFRSLCNGKNAYSVWSDMIVAIACTISNTVDKTEKVWKKREKEFAARAESIGGAEKLIKLYNAVVNALEINQEQDFLGSMFMALGLGSSWSGQFFTPYHIARAMAELTGDEEKAIKEKGYISVVDPSCGAGVTLIAKSNAIRAKRPDYQDHVLFAGQDIDRMAGLMCYIQMSLLGLAGYVCIADTLANPLTGHPLFPNEKEGQELWYTPMFFSKVWHLRRVWHGMDLMRKKRA